MYEKLDVNQIINKIIKLQYPEDLEHLEERMDLRKRLGGMTYRQLEKELERVKRGAQ